MQCGANVQEQEAVVQYSTRDGQRGPLLLLSGNGDPNHRHGETRRGQPRDADKAKNHSLKEHQSTMSFGFPEVT